MSPGRTNRVCKPGRFMHGKNDDLGGEAQLGDLASGFETVNDGHGNVHHDGVGTQLLGHMDGLGTVGGLAADSPLGSRTQNHANALVNHLVIVNNQDLYTQAAPLQGAKTTGISCELVWAKRGGIYF